MRAMDCRKFGWANVLLVRENKSPGRGEVRRVSRRKPALLIQDRGFCRRA